MYIRGANPVSVNIISLRYDAARDPTVIGDNHSHMMRIINHTCANLHVAPMRAISAEGMYDVPEGDRLEYLPPQTL